MLSTQSWLNGTALDRSAVIGISLVLIESGFDPNCPLNTSFFLFALTLVALALSNDPQIFNPQLDTNGTIPIKCQAVETDHTSDKYQAKTVTRLH
jgi:hypothetical protein